MKFSNFSYTCFIAMLRKSFLRYSYFSYKNIIHFLNCLKNSKQQKRTLQTKLGRLQSSISKNLVIVSNSNIFKVDFRFAYVMTSHTIDFIIPG